MAIVKRYAHINQAANATQNKLDAAEGYITGSLYVGQAATMATTLAVTGVSTLHNALPTVTDESDLGSQGQRWNNLFAKKVEAQTLSSSVAADFKGTLDVVGVSNLARLTGSAGAVFSHGNVVVSEGGIEATLGNIKAIGATSEMSAGFALKSGGTLDVTGQSDLRQAVRALATLDVSQDFKVASDKFTVYYSSGNTFVSGTLDVDKDLRIGENGASKFTVDSATGDLVGAGTATVAGVATFNAGGNTTGSFGVFVKNSLDVGGDLYVAGNLNIEGATVTLDASVLVVEDINIELGKLSGSTPSDNTASGGGITLHASADKTINWYRTGLHPQDVAATGWSVNTDFLPETDNQYNLGTVDDRWKKIYAKALDVNGIVSLGAVDVDSLAVDSNGAAIFGGGIAVTGTGSFTGQLSSSAAVKGLSLDIASTSAFGGLATFSGGGTVPSPRIFTIESGATLQVDGTANYASIGATGNIVAAGALTGSALRIHGVDLSPISASVVIDHTDQSAPLGSFALGLNQMMKLEVEAICGGGGAGGVAGAAFKLSIAAFKTGDDIDVQAIEISKEVFGVFGPSLDIDITQTAGPGGTPGFLTLVAKASQPIPDNYSYNWNMQVVKKMKMGQDGSAIEDRN